MSLPDRPHRSHLFAPASNEDLVRKALASSADAVVLDLEDAVAEGDREHAYRVVNAVSAAFADRPTHVRVGMVAGVYNPADIKLLQGMCVEAVRLPKASDPTQVKDVGDRLRAFGVESVIHLTVESAVGLHRLDQLIDASDRVARVVFGERDFLADVGIDEPGTLTDHARATIVIVSRAHSLGTPIDGAFIDLDDFDGLRQSCQRARSLGFGGKSALHPRQLDVIHGVFSPSDEERDHAREIVSAFDAALARGEATTVVGSRFVDRAVARRARSVLDFAEEHR